MIRSIRLINAPPEQAVTESPLDVDLDQVTALCCLMAVERKVNDSMTWGSAALGSRSFAPSSDQHLDSGTDELLVESSLDRLLGLEDPLQALVRDGHVDRVAQSRRRRSRTR